MFSYSLLHEFPIFIFYIEVMAHFAHIEDVYSPKFVSKSFCCHFWSGSIITSWCLLEGLSFPNWGVFVIMHKPLLVGCLLCLTVINILCCQYGLDNKVSEILEYESFKIVLFLKVLQLRMDFTDVKLNVCPFILKTWTVSHMYGMNLVHLHLWSLLLVSLLSHLEFILPNKALFHSDGVW